MNALIQALIVPRIAAAAAVARLTLRRAVLAVIAAFFGIGALLFLSVGIVVALIPAVGPAWAFLIMALVWALLAGFCLLLARRRARVVPLPAPAAPQTVRAPAGDTGGDTASAGMDRLRAGVGRAAPVLAIGALIAGIIAGRR